MIAVWHRLTAPWRRRREVRREDLARFDSTEEQMLALADDLKAWRKEQTVAVPLKLPPVHEPEPDEPDDGGCEYVGRHRAIGAGWGAPPVPPLRVTVPPIDWHIHTDEFDLHRTLWGRDLDEAPPVRGLAPTFVEVH